MMVTDMAKKTNLSDGHWPLGALGYASEIEDTFPDEAMYIGIITILWNMHDENLSSLFCFLLGAKSESLARAIIDKQPTHKAKRDLLALAHANIKLSKHRAGWLDVIIKETKRLADRRNSLVHGRYVVSFKDNGLYTEQNSPNSTRLKKPQKNGLRELKKVAEELETLIRITEGFMAEFIVRKVERSFRKLALRNESKSK